MIKSIVIIPMLCFNYYKQACHRHRLKFETSIRMRAYKTNMTNTKFTINNIHKTVPYDDRSLVIGSECVKRLHSSLVSNETATPGPRPRGPQPPAPGGPLPVGLL